MVRPVLVLATATALITLYLTAIAFPNANQAYRVLAYSLLSGQARTAVKPRVFTDDLLPSGAMVVYVSDIVSSTGEWHDLSSAIFERQPIRG